jgi:hypothetical protein
MNESQEANPGNFTYANKSRIANVLQALARDKYGIQINSEDYSNWEIVSYATGEADDVIDTRNTDEEILLVFQNGVNFLKDEEILLDYNEEYSKRMLWLKQVFTKLIPEQQESFINHLNLFSDVTLGIRHTTSLHELAQLRSTEGDLTASFFYDVLNPSVRDHVNFPTFVKTLNSLFRAGVFFDSFVDLSFDYKHNISRINPHIFNRIYFLLRCFGEGARTLKELNIPVLQAVLKREQFVIQQNNKLERRG